MVFTTEDQIKNAFGLKEMSIIRSKVDNPSGYYIIQNVREDKEMASILKVECIFTKCLFYCVPEMKTQQNQTKIYVNGKVRDQKQPLLCMKCMHVAI